jgi:hypothetical protein
MPLFLLKGSRSAQSALAVQQLTSFIVKFG